MPFTVNGTNFPLTTGTYTASFTPAFDDIASDYHLIAVSDANSDPTQNTVEFAGGIFVAASVTQSPPQNVLYVFGSNSNGVPESGGDTVYIHGASDTNPNTVVFDGGTPFPIGSTITAIHVRGEAGNDTFQADPDVTLPLWLYGGDGNNTLVGGAGNNVIVGGSGQNIIHSSNGINTPQTVDDSDTTAAFPGLADYFQDTGSLDEPNRVAGGLQRRRAIARGKQRARIQPCGHLQISIRPGIMTYMSPGRRSPVLRRPRSTAVWTDDAASSPSAGLIAAVNQTQAPADDQAAGVFWHDLGVFQATSGTLIVQLGTARHYRRGPGRCGHDRAANHGPADEPDHGQFWQSMPMGTFP